MDGVEEKSLVWGERWVLVVDKEELLILVLLLWCGSASYCGDTVVGNKEMINKIVAVLLIKKITSLRLWRC